MISLTSIKNFVKMNFVLVLIGTIQYILISHNRLSAFYGILINAFIYIIKNYILIFLIDYGTKNKEYIHPMPTESAYNLNGLFYITRSSIIDVLTMSLLIYLNLFNASNYYYDLVTFIPLSFMAELIFDFFHYWVHRICHMNKYLYRYIHKEHHMENHPSIITTYHQHPVDIILSNSIPLFISVLLVKLSLYQFSLLLIYKSFIEIGGHTGKILHPTASFPQFMWLPKLLGIELYTEDHDVHHTNVRYNFSKRFSIWDKIFATYKSFR